MTESLWTSSGATRLGKINSSKGEQPGGATQAVYGDSELERGACTTVEILKEGRGLPQRSGPSPSYDADSEGFQERLLTCMGNSVPGHRQMRREKPSFQEAPVNLLYKHSLHQQSRPDPTLATGPHLSLFSCPLSTPDPCLPSLPSF